MKSSAFAPLIELWHSRAPREQAFLTLAAMVLVLAGLYAAILDPALQASGRLKTELPAAQAKLAQVQQLAATVKAVGTPTSISQASLQASLGYANINATVSAAAPWVITLNSATGDALWPWLKANKVNKMTLKLSANGSWQGELTVE